MDLKKYIFVSLLSFALAVTGTITVLIAQARHWPFVLQIIGILMAGAGVIISWMNRYIVKK